MADNLITIGGRNIPCDNVPDVCPICNHACSPQFIKTHLIRMSNNEFMAQQIFSCPKKDCGEVFIATYRPKKDTRNQLVSYRLTRVEPRLPSPPKINENIISISEMFKVIYTQASEAEQRGLDQVAGVAYRKSLEFLIKDYCIHKSPENEEEIKKLMLAACINKFLDNDRIKTCAERAAWLGNDETHYTRKWEEHDINDLKTLIHLTTSWIDHELTTEEYLNSMEKKSPGK